MPRRREYRDLDDMMRPEADEPLDRPRPEEDDIEALAGLLAADYILDGELDFDWEIG